MQDKGIHYNGFLYRIQNNKICCYIAAFVFSCIFLALRGMGGYEMRLFPDDIGCMAVPATLGGVDWPEIIPLSLYKGFAYYFIFAPLFKLCHNPQIIWMVIVIANNLLLAFASVLAYHICTRYLQFKSGFLTAFLTVFGLFSVETVVTFNNEYVLYLLTWVVVLFLLKILNTDSYVPVVILGVVFGYSYLVHTRAIIFIVTTFFVLGLYCIKRKWVIKKSLILAVVTGISLLAAYFIREEVIKYVWGSGSSGMKNTSVLGDSSGYSTYFDFFSLKGIEVFVDMLVSNLTTITAHTMGLGALVFVAAFITFCYFFFTKKSIMEDKRMFAMLFSFFCVAIVLCGLILLWGKNVIGYYPLDFEKKGYKAFSYYRYYATFFGPAIVIILNECLESFEFRKKGILWTLPLATVVVILYRLLVADKISKSSFANRVFLSVLPSQAEGFDKINCRFFVICIFIVLAAVFISKTKKHLLMVYEFALVLILLSSFVLMENVQIMPQLNSAADGFAKLVDYLEENNIEMPDLYVKSEQRAYIAQFQVFDYPIHIGRKYFAQRPTLILCDRTEYIYGLYKCVRIDDNEYVWCNDDEMIEHIQHFVELGEQTWEN